MKNITLNIPDMQSTHCQARVSHAVKAIEGAQILSLEAGSIGLSLENESVANAVIGSIQKAGYTVEGYNSAEKKDDSSDCSTGCCKN